jgi:hypothetical protein
MKPATLAIATTLLCTSAAAEHVYHGVAEGDADLYGYGVGDQDVAAVQPRTGSSTDIYGDFGTRNGDLFTARDRGGSGIANPDRTLPHIYQGFGADPSLGW